jgi:DNA helicase-2/ATP-dependent DNA helicase PcrA
VGAVLENLNPEQRQAVTAEDGRLLVLAGAGSGKTRVLTTRIAHLLLERGVAPYRVLAFTFTNKAAKEMRQRVEALLQTAASECWVGTFHATGVRILRRECTHLGWQRSFAIYDTADSEAVLKDLLSTRTLPRHVSLNEIRQDISNWKNAQVDPRAALEQATDTLESVLAELYAQYDRILRRNNAFDFDDLVARPVQLFDRFPEIGKRYASRFQYVLVDEFQDTNGIQMRFIEQLSSVHGNLMVVGDDDQSIYSWRGARVENILEFEKRFPGARIIRLEQNYRSTSAILEASNGLIAHNRGRKGKKLWTDRQGGEPIDLHVCFDEEEEASRAVSLVQERVAAGRRRADIAYLYRTNAQSRALEDALRRSNIPYQIVGGTRFYERREVRDVVAYLKCIHNPADSVALLRSINVPRRGIGASTVDKLQTAAAANDWNVGETLRHLDALELSAASRKRVQQFAVLLDDLRKLSETATCQQVLQAVLDATNYFDYLRDSDPASYAGRRENVEELVSAAQAFAEESDDPSLRAFLEEISLLSDIDSMQDKVDQVTLMTLHSAKGLEYPIVLVTGLEEGLLPHAISSETLADLEEERRLFYVGMTRAEDELHLFSASNRRRYGDFQQMMPSRFLDEIPEAHLRRVEGEAPRARRAPWSPKSNAWRKYDEGDPDAFWRNQKIESELTREPILYDDDFSQEHVELVVGMRVRHERFGEGIVQKLEGQGEMTKITVLFGRHTSKKLVARYARLVPIL